MVRLIPNIVKFAVRQTWVVIRFATPWVLKFTIFAAGVSMRLSIIAAMTVLRGVDTVAGAIALDWKKRAVEVGFPNIWEIQLYWAYYLLAICIILAGWIVEALLAVVMFQLLISVMP